jgi:hypothetical protein
MSKLGRALFGTGSATGNAEFDKRFTVAGDPLALPPALVAAHLAGAVPGWSLYGTDLMTWRQGRIADPAQIFQLAAPLFPVADHLAGPAPVTGSGAAWPPR